jgi:N-acetylglucosamine malate deacetylase 1
MMINNFKKILVLAPHTDDGELGAGGSIAKFIENGAVVDYIGFSTAQESVPEHLPQDILSKEVRQATSALGIEEENLVILNYKVRKLNFSRQDILEDLIKIRRKKIYDLVLIPSLGDVHQDHATIAQEAVRAFKATTILSYELIWNNLSYDSTCFIHLDETHIQRKYQALQFYKSQEGRPYMSKDFIYSLAKVRGVQIGTEYAECFEVIRWVMS